jgi:hypothetical protein
LSKPRSPQVGGEEWDLAYAFEGEMYPPKTPFFPPFVHSFHKRADACESSLVRGPNPAVFQTGA